MWNIPWTLGRLPLPKHFRNRVAEQISRNVPFDEILNNIRDIISGNKLERLHLLTRKDLFSLKWLLI